MAENEVEATTQSKSKAPVFIGAVVVVVVVALVMFVMTRNGEAEDKKAKKQTENVEKTDDKSGEEEFSITLGDPVVAKVAGTDVKRSEVMNFISTQSEQIRQLPIQKLFPVALEQVVANKVLQTRVDTSGLDSDPEVKELVAETKGQIMRNIYIERAVDKAVTEKMILAEYEKLLKNIEGVKQTKASHILVEKEAEAKKMIKKLDNGGDFATLAKEHSTGPSGPNGGELGFFSERDMVPEFSKAAFALKVGEYTKKPVKTQFGWHVIKADDRRDMPEPEFESVKPQIKDVLEKRVIAQLLKDWREEAKVELYDINGDKPEAN